MSAIYYVEHVSYGCGDDATFHIRWNGVRMIVNLDHNPCPDATENLMTKKYTSACLGGDEDEVDAAQDEALDAIIRAGGSKFDELAPPLATPPCDLHSNLFPPQYSFRLVTVRGTMELLLEGSYLLEIPKTPKMGYENVVPLPRLQPPEPDLSTSAFQLKVDETRKLPRHVTTYI